MITSSIKRLAWAISIHAAIMIMGMLFGDIGTLPVQAQEVRPKSTTDLLWIRLIAHDPQMTDEIQYAVSSDGEMVIIREQAFGPHFEVRSGRLKPAEVRHIFSVVNTPEVLAAQDREPGERLFSNSVWTSIGLVVNGQVKSDARSFREELKDYPAAFQQEVERLRRKEKTLPLARNVQAILVVNTVENSRADAIRQDPRHLIDFLPLSMADLEKTPSLRQGMKFLAYRIAVKDQNELRTLRQYLRQSNRQDRASKFFLEINSQCYEVELRIKERG